MLVVEDLHWADRSTRDLLAFLAHNLRRERVLLVVTYRNDEPASGGSAPTWPSWTGVARSIGSSCPLGRGETAAQLAGILGATPAADLVDACSPAPRATRSSPKSCWRPCGLAPMSCRQPSVTCSGVGSRPCPTVPSRCSGWRRWPAGRCPIGCWPPWPAWTTDELVAALRGAVASQLLVIRPGEDGYQFRHALLQETVYAGLLPGERTRLHAAYARRSPSGPSWPMLAGGGGRELAAHWDAAGEPTRALPARVQAGLAAEEVHGFPEAHDHYERALELWDRVPEPGSRPGWTGSSCSPGRPTRPGSPGGSSVRWRCSPRR